MADPQIQADNVNVNLNFQGSFVDGIVGYINGLKESLVNGDDEALTSVMIVGLFIFAGVYMWRRL